MSLCLFAAGALLLLLALYVVPSLMHRSVLKQMRSLSNDFNKRFPLVHDREFGDVRNNQLFWRAETGPTLAGVQVDLTGFATGTPTLVQRQTFEFVKANASELFQSGLAAGRKALADASAGAQADDLRITGVSLEGNELYGFDLLMESESCAGVAPGGVAVTFRDKVVSEAEILKEEEPDDEIVKQESKPGKATKVVSGPEVTAGSEAETAFARYLQNAGRAAADEVPVTAAYVSSGSRCGVPLFVVSVAFTLVFLGFGWAMVEPGPRQTSFALGLVNAIISVCLYLRFGAPLIGVSQRLNESLLFRYVILYGKAIQRLPLTPSTTTMQRCERVTSNRHSTQREYAVFARTRGRRRILSPWCGTEADLSPLLARYQQAGFAILPIKRPGMTWLLVLLLIVVMVILLLLSYFVN